MKFEFSSYYQKIARSIMAIDIASPINGSFEYEDPAEIVWEDMMTNENSDVDDIIVVNKNNELYGFVFMDDWDAWLSPISGMVGERAERISNEQIVCTTYPVLDLFKKFLNHKILFIESEGEITHYLVFQDLNSTPVSISLFTVIMELENGISQFLSKCSNIDLGEAFIKKINSQRLYEINNLYKLRDEERRKSGHYQAEVIDDPQDIDWRKYLPYLNFDDKTRLFSFFPEYVKKLSFEFLHEYKIFFRKIKFLRNDLAHGNLLWQGYNEPDRKNFLEVITKLLLVVKSISKLGE